MSRIPMNFRLFAWSLLMVLASAPLALAQGILVDIHEHHHVRLPRPIIIVPPDHPHPTPPVPPATYKIKEISIQGRLKEQVAQVNMTQSFVNTGSQTMEVCFMFPLPYDSAIDQLTLLVDGKEFPAKLLERNEARRIYEGIVRKNKDPALLEWMGTGMFQTSVFPVPPGAERKVTLSYSQLCRKSGGMTDFIFPLSTARYTSHVIEKISVNLTIDSNVEIKNVYSPSHGIEVQRDPHHATVKYVAENTIPTSDFRLLYDVDPGQLAASVLTYRPNPNEDGFFLLLASPQVMSASAERQSKTVLLVIDRSGSMSGEKIEQAKGALKFILNNLKEGDLFNIVAYDTKVESFRPELERFNDETRRSALGFVEGIYAGGGTNIHGALSSAMGMLKDSSRPNYVLFMTDGLPTVGETNESRIVNDAKSANQVHARVIAFGVGYDVNSRLLDKLARTNFGQSEYVRPNDNIEVYVSRLYQKMETPVLTNVSVNFSLDTLRPEDGQAVNRVYPKEVFDIFAGEQLVVVGRYKRHGAAKVIIEGTVNGVKQTFDFPAALVEKSTDSTQAFVERLWAMRRIGEIIDQLDLSGHNEELVRELVTLSKQHGILTPYTSFLADETASPDLATNLRAAQDSLHDLEKSEGKEGVAQRAKKAELQRESNAASLAGLPAGGDDGKLVGGRRLRRLSAGMGGGGGAADSPLSNNVASSQFVDNDDNLVVVENVRNIDNKAFFYRQNRWVDSILTEEQEKNAKRIVQFSDEYFDLAKSKGKDLSQFLIFDEAMVVQLDGETYLIEPEEMMQ